MFQNLTSVSIVAIITGLAVIILLVILAVFVGKTSPRIGFLPWTTTWGDRFFFISARIAFHKFIVVEVRRTLYSNLRGSGS